MKRHAWLGLLLVLLVMALAGCGPQAAATAGDLSIYAPWVRDAVSGGSTAAYMRIKNSGAAADRLLTAEFAGAGRFEVMDTSMDGDTMHMETLAAIEIPANGEVELRPGGLHVMLMDLNQDLREGETASLTLVFEQAGSLTLDVPVKRAP